MFFSSLFKNKEKVCKQVPQLEYPSMLVIMTIKQIEDTYFLRLPLLEINKQKELIVWAEALLITFGTIFTDKETSQDFKFLDLNYDISFIVTALKICYSYGVLCNHPEYKKRALLGYALLGNISITEDDDFLKSVLEFNSFVDSFVEAIKNI